MRVNVYERILEWLSNCPEMGTYTYFNVIPIDPGNSSVNSNSSSIILNEFVNGSKEVLTHLFQMLKKMLMLVLIAKILINQ